MTPVDVIIWSCVIIFIATAVLTLLHISGLRTLPNSDHGKVLFRALIVEVVVVAVGVFASTLLPNNQKPNEGGLPGSMAHNQGVFLGSNQSNEPEPLLPKSSGFEESQVIEPPGEDCHQITVSDASTFPPTSRIETICDQ